MLVDAGGAGAALALCFLDRVEPLLMQCDNQWDAESVLFRQA